MNRARLIVATAVLLAWLPPSVLESYGVQSVHVPGTLHAAAMLILGFLFGGEIRDRWRGNGHDRE